MDKEEILEKNREDNRGADERFRILNQRQSSVMVGAMLVVWAALFLWISLTGRIRARLPPSCCQALRPWASSSSTRCA